MSLLGTERYLNNQNQSLSDCFAFTPEVEGWDPDVFLSTIIRNYATLPALYEDPDWMYSETDMWFKQHGNDFKRLWLAMRQEYNPIENYDRREDWSNNDQEYNTDGNTRTTSTVTDGEDSRSVATKDSEVLGRDVSTSGTAIEVTDEDGTLHKTGTDTEVVDDEASSTSRAPGASGANQSETTNYINAFDGGSTQHDRSVTVASASEDATSMDDKTTTMTHNTTDTNAVNKTVNTTTSGTEAEDATTNRTGSVTESGTQDVTVTTTDEVSGTGNKTNSGTRTGHAHGNIGVTTSQQMLRSEIELRVTNAYGIMAKVFADDMCLGIW